MRLYRSTCLSLPQPSPSPLPFSLFFRLTILAILSLSLACCRTLCGNLDSFQPREKAIENGIASAAELLADQEESERAYGGVVGEEWGAGGGGYGSR